jgi:sugar lactone lactonase YvrE
MKRLVLFFAVTLIVHPAHATPAIGDTSIFTRIGAPGMPEGLAVRDGTVYVSTHTSVRGNSGEGPSKIFRFDLATAESLGEIVATGQAVNGTHGLLAMAFDGNGRLYVLDRNPARVLRFDLTTSPPAQETYATLPNLAACRPVVQDPPCSPTTLDQATFPDYLAFDASGNLYITDLEAATIYRVTPGGDAGIWFQDARLDGVFGANGIAIGPDGNLYFAMTGSQQPGSVGLGIMYRLPLVDAPVAADLQTVFTWPEPAAGPDGFAFGASGRVYVALAGSNQVSVLQSGDTWSEVARFPSDPVANTQQEIPYDLPASIAFDGAGNILVTNQSFFAANADNWAVLRAWVNDFAQPLIEPVLP